MRSRGLTEANHAVACLMKQMEQRCDLPLLLHIWKLPAAWRHEQILQGCPSFGRQKLTSQHFRVLGKMLFMLCVLNEAGVSTV